MQREKKDAEEAARGKPDNADESPHSNQPKATNEDATKPSSTSKTAASGTTSEESKKQPTGSSHTRPKHQKTRSASAREATFASLQRALNAAVASREHCGPGDANDSDASVSPTAVVPPNNQITGSAADDGDDEQGIFHHSFSGLETAQDSPVPWTSQPSQEAFGYGALNTAFTSSEESLGAHALDGTTHQNSSNEVPSQNVQLQPPMEEWVNQVPAPSQPFAAHRAASDAGASYNTMQYSLQPPEVPLSRRGSSDESADTVEGTGVQTGSSHNLQQPGPPPAQTEEPAKGTGKGVDIAGRRKRPRPAAIGTSGAGRSLAASTMSPTARVPSANSGVRQSKSAQSLNSRYAGVKKASTAQRSPLNLSTFTEPGSLNTKAEMSSMLQPSVTTNSLAPPTPITPETLHHLLPTSPADGGYCLSTQTTNPFYPATQPMPVNIASPPATPLPMDMMSQFPYPNVAPPMSAPAQYSTFPDYGACDVPLTARTWADSATMPSPGMVFQDSCQVPQADISPIEYDPAFEQGGQVVAGSEAIPSPLVYPGKHADMPSIGEAKMNEFEIHEFPGQHEAHRYAAQQLPSQKRKNFVFANKTPTMAFGRGNHAS
jgi:hypothetical protein